MERRPEHPRRREDGLASAGRRRLPDALHRQGALPGLGRADQSWEGGGRQERYAAWRGPYYGFQTAELALGHTSYGLAGHYGLWVRRQVAEEQLKAWCQIHARGLAGFGGEAYDWDLPVRYHNSVWTAERTIEFLRTRDRAKPFLLAVGFQDPHHPHAVPTDFDLRVQPQDVPLPSWAEGELADKPPHFLEAREGRLERSAMRGAFPVAGQGAGFDFRTVGESDTRLGRAYYHTMVRLIDQQLGRILDALESLGLAENTLVVFTTDHGELLGDHGLWMKGPFHYEQLVRIPMIFRWPEGFGGGRRTASLVSQVDIVPTILSAAALAPAGGLDGADALGLLRGEAAAIRDHALVECVDDPHKLRLKTIVTADRKLTWYAGQDYGELYDLAADPQERVNHWSDPAYAGDRARLLGRLLTIMEPVERRVPERISYA